MLVKLLQFQRLCHLRPISPLSTDYYFFFFLFFIPPPTLLPSNCTGFVLPGLLGMMVGVINTVNCWCLLRKVMLISTGIVKPCFVSLTILTLKIHLALIMRAERFCRSRNTDFFALLAVSHVSFWIQYLICQNDLSPKSLLIALPNQILNG